MRRLPSWFRFLAVTIAFELIVGSSEVARLVGALIPKTWWSLVGTKAATIVFMALFAPLTLQSDGLRLDDLGVSAKDWQRHAPGAVLWGALLALLSMGVKALIGHWGVSDPVNPGLIDILKEMGQAPELGIAFIVSYGLLGPLVEEFQFRAYAVESLSRVWGDSPRRQWSYLTLSALVFMVSHQVAHPIYYPAYFLAGLFLGGIYIRTRSLAACVLAHGTANLLQLIVGYWIAR